ncbi:DUF1439 domain-containing protein [Gallaecimonas kandeliae]|uniref:DUF1439 domain-containing protein n=1 Tax=Gallaecimonas kandeliae TaxID=3029055 RepID=UPI0026495652|nr:DUF1439 domain-containing protein [Gallaecimonas kandeliae]WKE65165.1 DUF1439 domain-containing protein [Gallaecimonas kandeliae]
MKKILSCLALLLLAGCAQLQSLTSYSLTESELQDQLRGQLDGWSSDLGHNIGVRTKIDQLDIKLADQKARINLGGEAALTSALQSMPLALHLEVEGRPALEGKAVFLRDLRLLDAKADLLGFGGHLGPSGGALGRWLTQYLDNHPIYRIPDGSALAAIPLDMAVMDGKLVFKPRTP